MTKVSEGFDCLKGFIAAKFKNSKISLDKTENENFQTLSSNDCQSINCCFKSHMLTVFDLKIEINVIFLRKVA